MADFPPVDIREHDVEDNQVWAVLLHHHARIEAVGGNPDLKGHLPEGLIYSRDEIRLIVDKQDFSLPLSRASVGMPLSFMNLYSALARMRRNFEPGTGSL